MSATTSDSPSIVDTSSDATNIPVIDIGAFFGGSEDDRQRVATAVAAACESIGFLVVTGHGVPQDAIDAIYTDTVAFFALAPEEKMLVAGPEGDTYTAYSPIGDPYGDSGGAPRPNLREVYHASRFDTPAQAAAFGYPADVVSSMPPNSWPARPPTYEASWKRYFREMEALADRMLQIFAVSLGLDEGWFADKVDQHLGTMAANCYVEQPVEPEPGQIRIRAHVDFSTLTILYQDDSPGGLQAHRRGTGWVDVPYVAGSYVVNLGDIMGRWTNDQWVATPHRVLNPPREFAMTRRMSLPFFHLPNHDAVIESIPTCVTEDRPAKYLPIEAGEWTAARRAGRSANHARIR